MNFINIDYSAHMSSTDTKYIIYYRNRMFENFGCTLGKICFGGMSKVKKKRELDAPVVGSRSYFDRVYNTQLKYFVSKTIVCNISFIFPAVIIIILNGVLVSCGHYFTK